MSNDKQKPTLIGPEGWIKVNGTGPVRPAAVAPQMASQMAKLEAVVIKPQKQSAKTGQAKSPPPAVPDVATSPQ